MDTGYVTGGGGRIAAILLLARPANWPFGYLRRYSSKSAVLLLCAIDCQKTISGSGFGTVGGVLRRPACCLNRQPQNPIDSPDQPGHPDVKILAVVDLDRVAISEVLYILRELGRVRHCGAENQNGNQRDFFAQGCFDLDPYG